MGWLWLALFFLMTCTLAYRRATTPVVTIALSFYLAVMSIFGPVGYVALSLIWLVFLLLAIPFNVPSFRLTFITPTILRMFSSMMPTISDTEEAALSSGTVGFEGSLLSGNPNWSQLQSQCHSKLTEKEQQFIDGPVEDVCRMINDWNITRFPIGVPDKIWNFLTSNKFFAMIIPESYGGLGFSARAHSEVICKLATANGAVGTVSSVPNSLGPGELLLQYGTQQQKDYFLPRLAAGTEIPCFALTSPLAGSDAGSMQDHGVVCQRDIEGKPTLGLLLTFNKRYITLAPIATLIGLAFKVYDPEHLLGDKVDLGITCALLAANTPGVKVGRHHWPLNSAFPNGPISGDNIFITLDQVIGGVEKIGCGWRMLMECLATGRGISIPSIYTGGARKAALASGAYSTVRQQFGVSVAQFGGVQEALARIAANAVITESMRTFITTALDSGERSAVAAAISKYHSTELGRAAIIDAMDVHGGKGICMGPRNYLAQSFIETPIGVTVEGANILTRSMMIFGQGIMRCHPFLLKEIKALQQPDKKTRLKDFDQAFFAHTGHYIGNIFRSIALGITHAYLPLPVDSPHKRYYQHFNRFSANLACLSDMALVVYGGSIKRKETISARLGDLLSYLYQGSSVLLYAQQHQELSELEIIDYICQDLCYKMQETMAALLRQLPPVFRWLGRLFCLPLGKRYAPASDRVMAQVAKALSQPSALRDVLANNLYMHAADENPAGQMNASLEPILEVAPIERQIKQAWKSGVIQARDFSEAAELALQQQIISDKDYELVTRVMQLRYHLISVDDFSVTELKDLQRQAMQGRVASIVE